MISQTVDYSLRAMVVLACRYNRVTSVREIAENTKVPSPYLAKLMRQLVRAQLVESQRGVGGGFMLARPPREISIWDVVQAIDPIQRPRFCAPDPEGGAELCSLQRILNQVIDEIEQAFRSLSLADVVAEDGRGNEGQR